MTSITHASTKTHSYIVEGESIDDRAIDGMKHVANVNPFVEGIGWLEHHIDEHFIVRASDFHTYTVPFRGCQRVLSGLSKNLIDLVGAANPPIKRSIHRVTKKAVDLETYGREQRGKMVFIRNDDRP